MKDNRGVVRPLLMVLFSLFWLFSCENPYMRRDLQPIMDARGDDEPDVFYTVSFNSMGGSPVEDQSVRSGRKVVKPDDPTRDEHAFFAWYKDDDCTEIWDFAVDTVKEDIILYARWIQNTVVVTVSLVQILDGTPIMNDSYIISRSGTPQKAAVFVPSAGNFDEIKWQIAKLDGTFLTVNDVDEFELDATDVSYNSLGNHVLLLEVKIGDRTYNVNIHFTIVE